MRTVSYVKVHEVYERNNDAISANDDPDYTRQDYDIALACWDKSDAVTFNDYIQVSGALHKVQ